MREIGGQAHGVARATGTATAGAPCVLQYSSATTACASRAGRLTVAAEVDHIAPRSLGGVESPENLQSICKRFRRPKVASEGATARHMGIPGGDISMVKW